MATFEQLSEAVLASLEKLGPAAPKAIFDDTGIRYVTLLEVLARMAEEGTIKAQGERRGRKYALKTQEFPGAPKREPAPAVAAWPKKGKRAKPKRVRKARVQKKAKRAYTKRKGKAGTARRRARPVFPRDEQGRVVDAPPAAHAMQHPLEVTLRRLRFAFDEHLAAITDARQKLFGLAPLSVPQPAPLAKAA
jgi:hypothetical protein